MAIYKATVKFRVMRDNSLTVLYVRKELSQKPCMILTGIQNIGLIRTRYNYQLNLILPSPQARGL